MAPKIQLDPEGYAWDKIHMLPFAHPSNAHPLTLGSPGNPQGETLGEHLGGALGGISRKDLRGSPRGFPGGPQLEGSAIGRWRNWSPLRYTDSLTVGVAAFPTRSKVEASHARPLDNERRGRLPPTLP